MRIVVIGAGAMGGLYGGLLAASGVEVELVDLDRPHVQAINRDGLRLGGISGELTIPVAAATPDAAAGGADVALIQTDANATSAAAQTAARLLAPTGWAVTLQNGIGNIERLVAVLGAERVVGGLSYHSAALDGPGRVLHTHAGPTWLGELDGRRSDRVDGLAAQLAAAGFTPSVVEDILAHIWSKFIHNAAINPVCALLGLRVGEIPMTPEADLLQTRVIEEILQVVRARGIRLVDPDPMATIKAFCRTKFNKPSMLQHMEACKHTEIEALNGAVVREAQALGIPVPYNQALAWMVRGLERARIRQAEEGPFDYAALEAAARARAESPA